MADFPSLTVLICCYSGERFFEETFESVARQRGVDFDIVIHDNGCFNSYSKKIRRAAARIGAQVIRSDVNRYGEGVRFDALPHITTDYIATLHDDDVIDPGRLLADMTAIVEHDFDYLFSDRRYINEDSLNFLPSAAEINTEEFGSGDYPYLFVAETFFRGLRFHYSTFVIRTSVAQSLVYGDPYLPRIADCLFATKLLLNRSLRGIAASYKSTAIRVHGLNDMLYEKFERGRKEEEIFLLTQSELYIFDWIIREAELDQLASIFAFFPGIEHYSGEDRPSLLVRAALKLQHWGRSKKLMAAHCVHEAYRLAPTRTVMSFRKWTDTDCNDFMMKLYGAYAREEIAEAGALSETIHPDSLELAKIKSSPVWKLAQQLHRPRFLSWGRRDDDTKSALLYDFGTRLYLSSPEAARYIVAGMSFPESWGRWTDGFKASFRFRHEQEGNNATLELVPFIVFEPTMQGREISVAVNGRVHASCVPVPGTPILIPLDRRVFRRFNVIQIDIGIPAPKTPEIEPTNELRALGVGFESLVITAIR